MQNCWNCIAHILWLIHVFHSYQNSRDIAQNSLVIWFHSLVCIHCTDPTSLRRRKRRRNYGCPCFNTLIFRLGRWLVHRSKEVRVRKDVVRLLKFFCFLQRKFWFQWKPWPQGCQLTLLQTWHAHLVLESCCAPTNVSLQEFCIYFIANVRLSPRLTSLVLSQPPPRSQSPFNFPSPQP